MTNGGDAAEQVVRLSLEGFEVAARLTGSAAKNVAILLASVLKQEATQANKTRGKAKHSVVGSYADRWTFYYGAVIHYDHDGLWQIF